MSSRSLSSLLLTILLIHGFAVASSLRVCADPDNLPFSNRARQGFDNEIAALIAKDLNRQLVFVWARARRGFLREQFNKGACDVLMGVPVGMQRVATTHPYYRSTYVFVTSSREHLQIASFDDPRLNGRRIGLQILEEDMSPPSLPLIRNGHAAQLVGFQSFGSTGDIVKAVATERVGASVVWGPIAGYFAAKQHLPVTLTPVSPSTDASGIPFAFP
jgi:mxaJ protein